MKKWLLLLAVPVVLLLVVPALKSNSDEEEGIQITVATLGNLEERADGSGALEGVTRVDVSAETGGLIESIPVEEGDTVEVGQLLVSLETTQARANLNSAASQIQSSMIALDQAERELVRTTQLYAEELTSEEDYQTAVENAELRTQELYRANLSYTLADNELGKTSYYSPVNGIVTALNVEVGETAVQGTMNNAGTVLMTVEDMSTFRVRVTMVESEVVAVREGMQAEVTLDALPDTVFTGTVEQVGLSATSSGGGETAAEFEVLLRLDSVDESMRSGMSASVEIVTASAENCVTVPVQSIVQRADPENPAEMVSSVLVLQDGVISVKPVTAGVSSIMEVQVEGVSPGSRVVSGPVDALRTLNDGDVPGEESDGDSSENSDDSSGFSMRGIPGTGGGPGGGGPPPGGGH